MLKRSRVRGLVVMLIVIFAGIGYLILHNSRAATNADINGDGAIDVFDLSILASNYGQSGKTFAQGDINGDGTVNVFDFSILATNWGGSPGGGSTAISWNLAYQQTDGDIEQQTLGGANATDPAQMVKGSGVGNTIEGKRCPWDPDETVGYSFLSGSYTVGQTFVARHCFTLDWYGRGVHVSPIPAGTVGTAKIWDIDAPERVFTYTLNDTQHLCIWSEYQDTTGRYPLVDSNNYVAPYSDPLPWDFYRIHNDGLDGIGRHWMMEVSVTPQTKRIQTGASADMVGFAMHYNIWITAHCKENPFTGADWITDVPPAIWQNGSLIEDHGYTVKHIQTTL